MNLLGYDLVEILTVKDTRESILSGIQRGFSHADLIIATGGLGPTEDDMTKTALADYFDDELVFHPQSFERIKERLEQFGKTPLEAHRRQAYLPVGARLFSNRFGTAPGMGFSKDQKRLYSLPGVPYEMKAIFMDHLADDIRSMSGNGWIAHQTISTVGEGEARLAEKIRDITDAFPRDIKLAFLPSLGTVRIRLSSRNRKMEGRLEEGARAISERLNEFVFSTTGESLPEAVIRMLRQDNKMIAFAESCTGGYLAQQITAIPGASDVLEGGIVSYSNDVKMKVLGVSEETLKKWGAVSHQTAREMALGARKATGADLALSTTGIAGPGGGSEDKPVGTVFLCLTDGNKFKEIKLSLNKDRKLNIHYTSVIALNMIRKFLSGE